MRLLQRHRSLALGLMGLAGFLGVWELATATLRLVDPLFLSAPSAILSEFGLLLRSGELNPHLWASLKEFSVALALAIVVGVPFGLLLGRLAVLQEVLDPLVMAFYSMPKVALLPLFLVWFGIGFTSIFTLVFVMAVFPIIINCLAGAKTVNPALVEAARVFGAREKDIFVLVVWPSTLPLILTGIRLGLGAALIGVVVAEFYIGNSGLGFVLVEAGATFRTPKIFVVVTLLMAAAIVLSKWLEWIERRLAPWKYR